MPFISQLTSYKSDIEGRKFDGYVTLESQLFVSCDLYVTLNAVVIGDLAGHVLEWTQVSGYPVIFMSSLDEPHVVFQQPNIRDDKVFRLYVDKGTVNQEFHEILVTAVPQEHVKLPDAPPYPVITGSIAAERATSLFMPPGFSPLGTASVDNAARMITWARPNGSNFVKSVVMERQADGSFTPHDVGASTVFTGAQVQTSYRVDTVVSSSGVSRVAQSAPVSFVPVAGAHDVDAADSFLLPGSVFQHAKMTVLGRLTRELTAAQGVDETMTLPGVKPGVSRLTVLETIRRELAAAAAPDDSAVLYFNHSTSNLMKILEVKTVGITSLG